MFLVGRVPIFGPFPPATAVAGYNPIRRIKGDTRFIPSTKVAKRDGAQEIGTCLRRIALDGLACPFRGLVIVALIDARAQSQARTASPQSRGRRRDRTHGPALPVPTRRTD